MFSFNFRIFLLFFLIYKISATDVTKCSEGDLPIVEISNCEKPPCTFYINSRNDMTMKFNSPKYLEKFRPNVMATTMGISINYPLGQDDGCVGVTNTPCPIAKNEYVEYTYGMFLLPFFPEANVNIEFSLVDLESNNTNVVCFNANIQTKKKS